MNRKVSLTAESEELVSVLNELFTSSDISYRIIGQDIILAREEMRTAKLDQEKQVEVSGTVILGNDNQPAPGVTVSVAGTSIGTTTDIDGKYSLMIPASTVEITFSYIGYRTKTIKVKDRLLFQLVVMEESTELLDEVVVVGFGTQKKESLVGAIHQITAAQSLMAFCTTAIELQKYRGKPCLLQNFGVCG